MLQVLSYVDVVEYIVIDDPGYRQSIVGDWRQGKDIICGIEGRKKKEPEKRISINNAASVERCLDYSASANE